jgi:hypothetical protein
MKHPRPERQPAGTAGRNERAHRQLRSADLPASSPAQPGAEDRSEHHHIGGEGQAFEGRGQHQPTWARARESVANLAQPRREQEDRNQDAERGNRLE